MFSTILLTLIILLIYCWPSDTFRLDHIGDGSKPIIAILLPWGNKHPLTSVNLLQGLRQDDSHGAGQGWRAGGVPGEDWQDDRGESQRRPDFSDFFGKLDDIGGLFFWILVLRQAEELEKRVSLSFGIGGFRIFRDEWHPPGIYLVLSWYSPWWGACVRPPVKKNTWIHMNISSSAQFYIAMEGHVQFLMRRPFWNAWSGVFHSRSRPWGHGRGIFKQVLSAIQHMHSKNVLHRDLKSDNILPHDVLGLTLG